MIGLAYIVISDKWEEHKLRQAAAAAKAESENSSSDIPDADIEGVVKSSAIMGLLIMTGES